MTTVLFVHGTGVRRETFDGTFAVIKHNLLSRRKGLVISPCYWGTLGADLYANGASIPDYAKTRRLDHEPTTEEDYQVALWGRLYSDPLFELRVLSLKADDTSGSYVQAGPPPTDPLRNFMPSDALQTKLEEVGIRDVFEAALQSVQDTSAYKQALQAATNDSDQLTAATARAIIAMAIVLCNEKQKYALIVTDASTRDQVIQQIGDELVGIYSRRSLVGWATKHMCEFALSLGAMDLAQRKRGALTDATYPFAGDILLYQGRGEKIRQFIGKCVQQAEPPVVLLAHSLGGIVCVDLLAEHALPQVQLLITIGSQAPFLYEINALHNLRWQEPLPAHFPPVWLNIYDLRDFLSYIGEIVFPGRIKDVPVDGKQPFPYAHGAYFTNPQTWEAIMPFVP